MDRKLTADEERMLASLTPREQRMLRMRFGIGINQHENITLVEVAQRYEATRKRISDIEARVLRKRPKR
jgi:RNA polymerase primary sigma factor